MIVIYLGGVFMEEKAKRVRRSKEEIAQDKIQKLEEKKANYLAKISEIEKEIEELKNPPKAEIKKKDVWNRAEELGVTTEELMALVEKAGKKKNQE
jgi:hypothetical protein